MIGCIRRHLWPLVLSVTGSLVLVITATIFLRELFSPSHSLVSPQNGPLSMSLGFLVGIGWLLIGAGAGTLVVHRARYGALLGAILGTTMGLIGWEIMSALFVFS